MYNLFKVNQVRPLLFILLVTDAMNKITFSNITL
jgi:hypothetical protein